MMTRQGAHGKEHRIQRALCNHEHKNKELSTAGGFFFSSFFWHGFGFVKICINSLEQTSQVTTLDVYLAQRGQTAQFLPHLAQMRRNK